MAVTKPLRHSVSRGWLALLVSLFSAVAHAAVLPEERVDVLYHSYDGGGMEINGPSILVRKNIGETVSVSANYYVDMVTSASIDVVTQASKYTEKRKEKSVTVDYLHDKTTFSTGFTRSDENDYQANTAYFGIAQDVFGDLTTITMGYSRGWDTVENVTEPAFEEEARRQKYSLGVTQVLTKSLIANLSYDYTTDEGFLNNPYRTVRYKDPNNPNNFLREPEHYPNTRTSEAIAIRGKYFLPYRAAVSVEYRYFSDTWDIVADNYEIAYTHPLGDSLILDLKYRYYQQDKAEFYRDLFESSEETVFRARDKEMSTFESTTIGAGISYELPLTKVELFDRATVNFYLDHMRFDYDDFRDVREHNGTTVVAGQESLYGFSANVIRFFVSAWY